MGLGFGLHNKHEKKEELVNLGALSQPALASYGQCTAAQLKSLHFCTPVNAAIFPGEAISNSGVSFLSFCHLARERN